MQNSYGIVREDTCEVTFSINLTKNGYGATERGSFEVYDVKTKGDRYYGEGSLSFENNVLVDYDGVYALMPQIVKKLGELGLGVEDMARSLEIDLGEEE